ncbi:hypothetical protein JAAARDRAFT_63770 [Jaapia argillacea MUCL 33604]|uniref:Uncharacterized protein n=1 Tax=Jaapia argillacea MUCL 33604 TaxID=933084 RepID=A0A067P3G8_9AGAM|nr:hypothetical protein JAAARDRAFT_63770 [Jaapia argillacea MUCL 33604]
MSDDTLGLDPAIQQRIQGILSAPLDEEAVAAELDKIIIGPPFRRFPAVAYFEGPKVVVKVELKPGIFPLGGEEFDGMIHPPVEGKSVGNLYVRRPLQGSYRIKVSITQERTTIVFRKRLIRDHRRPGEEEPNPAEEPDESEYLDDPIRVDAVVRTGFASSVNDTNGFGVWRRSGVRPPVRA